MKAKKSGEHYWLAGNVTGGGEGVVVGGGTYHGETREVESLEPAGGEENNQIIIMKTCRQEMSHLLSLTNQLTLMNHNK